MIPIIGLAGPKGVGKTTLANMIVESPECGQTQRDSFARTLKDMLIAMGVPKRNIDGSQEEKDQPIEFLEGMSAREAMLSLGTEWGRDMIHPNVWVNALIWRWVQRSHPPTVVDDVRFDNEAEAILKNNGVVILLQRKGVTFDGVHRSEKGVSVNYIDATISGGTPDEMFNSFLEYKHT